MQPQALDGTQGSLTLTPSNAPSLRSDPPGKCVELIYALADELYHRLGGDDEWLLGGYEPQAIKDARQVGWLPPKER